MSDVEPEAPHIRLLLSRWEEVDGRAGWSPQFTPALPSPWPPRGRRPRLVWYGFAYGFSSFPPTDLVDAVEVGGLWGRAEQTEGGGTPSLSFEQLSRTVEKVGVQGTHPMDPDDLARARGLADAERRVVSRSTVPLRRRGIDAYAGWLSNNGAIAEQLPSAHDPFLAWIRARSG